MKQKSVLGLAALSSAVVVVLQSNSAFAQLRAFGEAEGYGAIATGGRNSAAPTIYHVTNLNDSGAGSFRDAVTGGSNRIVVFDVAGEITLKSGIGAQSNITIAGQTAPGAGITITGYQAIGFTQRTNDIMRYIRMRPGDNSPASDNGMSMTRTGTAILDHVSIEFGKYNNIDAVADTTDTPRITIQNSIIADPISTGTSTRGQGFGAHLEAVNGYYTITNNLWANSHSRNPLAKVNDQFTNNIEYNNEIGYLTSGTSTPFKHDLVNNAFIAGPNYTSSSDYGTLSTPDKFYASGNVQDANRNGVFDGTISNPSATNPNSATPYLGGTAALPTMSVNDAYTHVIAHAGSSQARDTLDNLVVGQVQTLGSGTAGYTAGTTGPVSTTVPFDTAHEGLYWKAYLTGLDNGGLGTTASSSRPAGFDADNDGVADSWELTHGMSSSNASDALAKNPLGYFMIEQYINELGATNDTQTTAGVNGAWTSTATWGGGVVPKAVDYAAIRGSGATNGVVSVSGGTAAAMDVSIGGGGPAAGETLNINGGTLNVYDQVNIGDAGNATVNLSSGTLNTYNIVLGRTVTGGATLNYTGTLNVSGGMLIANQIVLGGGAPGAWNTGGQINFSGGTIKATSQYDANGGWVSNALMNINAPIAISGSSATIDTNAVPTTVSGALSGTGSLTKIGAGTLTLSGNNSAYAGGINLNVGTISLATTAANSSTGAITAANGTTLNVATSGASTPLTAASGATVTLTAGGITYNGAISGAANSTVLVSNSSTGTSNFSIGGNLTGLAGTLDLGTSTGNIRIGSSGSAATSFDLGDATASLRSSSSGNVNLGSLTGATGTKLQGSTADNAAVTWVVGGNNKSTTFSGSIANGTSATAPGVTGFTKVGAGTQSLTGTGSYTGATTVQAGVLKMTGGTYNNVLANAGGLDLQGGQFVFDYTGTTSPLAQVKTFLASGYANNFATGQIRDTTAGTTKGIAYTDSGTTLTLQPALFGDASLDGKVDFNDFLALQANFGSSGTTFATGDFNYDGVTNFNDFLMLQANFGQSLTGSSVTVTASQVAAMTAFAQSVPEPTAAIAIFGMAGLAAARRRRLSPQ